MFSRLLSISRERDVDVRNVLSRKLCAVLLDLFYPNGAMRRTAKSNQLNKIEIKWYLLPSLIRNPDLGATVLDFMAILESSYYSMFESFSNVADEISAKLLSSFLECEVLLVVVPDRYDFKFLNKICWKKRRTEDSTHMQEIEIVGNRKIPTSFQNYLGNSNNKINLVKYVFQK